MHLACERFAPTLNPKPLDPQFSWFRPGLVITHRTIWPAGHSRQQWSSSCPINSSRHRQVLKKKKYLLFLGGCAGDDASGGTASTGKPALRQRHVATGADPTSHLESRVPTLKLHRLRRSRSSGSSQVHLLSPPLRGDEPFVYIRDTTLAQKDIKPCQVAR